MRYYCLSKVLGNMKNTPEYIFIIYSPMLQLSSYVHTNLRIYSEYPGILENIVHSHLWRLLLTKSTIPQHSPLSRSSHVSQSILNSE